VSFDSAAVPPTGDSLARRPGVAAAFGHRNALMSWAHSQTEPADRRHDTTGMGTRTAVLHAAVGLFAQHGFAGSTMKDLARAANVKAPALYNHFQSKEQILGEAIRRAMGIFILTVLGPLDAQPVDRWLERVVWSHTEYQMSDPELQSAHELLYRSENLSPHLSPADHKVLVWTQREYVDLMRALIEIATGSSLTSSERTVAAFGIIAMCDRTSSWFRPGGPESSEQVAAAMWTLVATMLRVED
jgi:AcrR family transcriptional regulator